MAQQDWTTVSIGKVEKKSKGSASEKEVNAARRRQEHVETMKRFMGGQNKSTKIPVPHASKIEEDTGNYRVDRVSHSFAKALREARMAKNMTQAQLAQAINEKSSLINDYEGGRAVPNGQVINKLNRALGTHLPRARDKQPRQGEPEP